MGWYFGWYSRKNLVEHLLEPFSSEDKSVTTKPIAHCFKGNNMWTVWERTKTGTRTVTLAPGIEAPKPFSESIRFIVLYYLRRGGKEDWGYKDVSEDMGPCEANCPPSYLEMAPLAEHHGEHAESWRERVKAYWARCQRDLSKEMVDGQGFKANGNDYVYRPWREGDSKNAAGRTSNMAGLGNQIVKTVTVRGIKVDVVGCWDSDTPDGEYDFYDFYVGSECINEGEPHYDKEKGLMTAIEGCLDLRDALKS